MFKLPFLSKLILLLFHWNFRVCFRCWYWYVTDTRTKLNDNPPALLKTMSLSGFQRAPPRVRRISSGLIVYTGQSSWDLTMRWWCLRAILRPGHAGSFYRHFAIISVGEIWGFMAEIGSGKSLGFKFFLFPEIFRDFQRFLQNRKRWFCWDQTTLSRFSRDFQRFPEIFLR